MPVRAASAVLLVLALPPSCAWELPPRPGRPPGGPAMPPASPGAGVPLLSEEQGETLERAEGMLRAARGLEDALCGLVNFKWGEGQQTRKQDCEHMELLFLHAAAHFAGLEEALEAGRGRADGRALSDRLAMRAGEAWQAARQHGKALGYFAKVGRRGGDASLRVRALAAAHRLCDWLDDAAGAARARAAIRGELPALPAEERARWRRWLALHEPDAAGR